MAVELRFFCLCMGNIEHDSDNWLVIASLIPTSGVRTAQIDGVH